MRVGNLLKKMLWIDGNYISYLQAKVDSLERVLNRATNVDTVVLLRKDLQQANKDLDAARAIYRRHLVGAR